MTKSNCDRLCKKGPYAMITVFAEIADKHWSVVFSQNFIIVLSKSPIPLLFLLMHYIDLSVKYFVSYSSPKWSTDAAFITYMDMVAKDANMIYIVARTAGRFDDSKARVSNGRGVWISKSFHLWMKILIYVYTVRRWWTLLVSNYSLFDQDNRCSLVESCHDAM